MKKILIIVLIICVFAVAYSMYRSQISKVFSTSSSIVNKTWAWEKTVTNEETTNNPNPSKNYIIHFNEEGLSGTDGCNGFSATYKLDGNNITISGNMAMTQKYCGQSSEKDNAFFRFTSAISFQFDPSGELVLITKDGSQLYFKDVTVKNFKECKDAGYGLETPTKCVTPFGLTFTDDSPTVAGSDGCYVSGCSNQICTDKKEGVMTTCEAKPEFACYQYSSCERQISGECGWTKTNEMTMCLNRIER